MEEVSFDMAGMDWNGEKSILAGLEWHGMKENNVGHILDNLLVTQDPNFVLLDPAGHNLVNVLVKNNLILIPLDPAGHNLVNLLQVIGST
jgi:hypothetical protein